MKSKSRKSFGLIETLVACAILIMIAGAVLAINVILNNNLQFTRERAHAYYRAMETIEAVRIIRDTNYVDGDDSTNWNSLVCNNASGTIQIPATNGTTKYYPNFNCDAPGMNGKFFLFPISGNAGIGRTSFGTDYTIYLTFEKSGINPDLDGGSLDDNSIKAVATVEWSSRGKSHKIELKEVLTNWKQAL